MAAIDVQDSPVMKGDLQEQDAVHDVADLAGPPERGKLAAEPVVAFRRVPGVG